MRDFQHDHSGNPLNASTFLLNHLETNRPADLKRPANNKYIQCIKFPLLV